VSWQRADQLAAVFVELVAVNGLVAAFLKDLKYREMDTNTALGVEDLVIVGAVFAGVLAVALAAPALGLALAVACVALASLDAFLFRVFTLQLGAAGARALLPILARGPVPEAGRASAFAGSHKLLALLPLSAIVANFELVHRGVALTRSPAALLLVPYWLVLAAGLPRPARRVSIALFALLALADGAGAFEAGAPGLTATMAVGALALAVLAIVRGWRSKERDHTPAFLGNFFRAVRLPDGRGLAIRPEDAALERLAPRTSVPSALHGRLRGADVILVTLESVGREHLARFRAGGAAAPLIDERWSRSVSSRRHICISPNTNNAHEAIYASGYPAASKGALLARVAEAGYQTAYLTAARTGDYGLRALLDAIGFAHVLDASALDHATSDYALLDAGVERLREIRRAGAPLFLHVQTVNTHVPYRVVDTRRFGRRDAADERGRFLDGVEETTWIVAELLARLEERGLVRRPLVVITSDHGQAFGELGYRVHSNAVIRPEIDLPFLMEHEALEPRAIEWSSHFDVLPTVMDLLGVAPRGEIFGDSLFSARGEPALLLFAEAAREHVPSHFGLVIGERKLMFDLVLHRYLELDWNDRVVRELRGSERQYYLALVHAIGARVGLL
jgi:hypothetical protein